ncbi:GDP-mannose 4,6-dehydratase [Xanthobacter pseudotagetidis]|uniref:GDP-mannose 4,6-dehydratase n=1 Tax=Xanthobacter pseudotagetidis TaxID=3119911 RepID=UPI00372B8FE3
MVKRALITGVSGQDGSYLAKSLLEKGYHVTGALRRSSHPETIRLEKLGIADKIEYAYFDLAEVNNITRLVRDGAFDEIYNLAAQSFVGSSWDQPVYAAEVNGLGVVRLLDAIRTYAPQARFYQASTSEMFGLVRTIPQNEDTPFHPRSPYGVAKTYGHYITVNYRESFGTHASSGILFNHESPLRGTEFVTRKISRGLARFTRGVGDAVELGNLDAKRDWGFAGDYVEGMWAMLQQETADDYVLATGKTTSIRDFVRYAAEALALDLEWSGAAKAEQAVDRKTGKVAVRINPKFYRPAEVSLLLGDASKARAKLGWEPKVDVRELAAMMARADYDDWQG